MDGRKWMAVFGHPYNERKWMAVLVIHLFF